MKKLLLTALLASVSVSSFAASHGPAGCGLGTAVVFQDANEWYEHVMAATTNGSASQTVAMTSGTWGCEDANGPLAGGIAMFLNDNLEPLAIDMAKGNGETLGALANLMGVKGADKAVFNEQMQAHFDTVFADAQANPTTAYNGIMSVMAGSKQLSKYLG